MATGVIMRFGDVEARGTLNDGETARAFAERLPTTIRVSGTGIDFCGQMPFALPYDEADVHNGWTNGDINYNPHGGWFALLYDDEENSARYGDQLVMGRVEGSLDALRALGGSYDLRIEVEKEGERR